MQEGSNQECHFHKGQKVIAYCTNNICQFHTGRCQSCLNELYHIGCQLAHITNFDDMPQYIDSQLQQLISFLRKLYSNNCQILEVQKGIVKKYSEQISSIQEINNLILEEIDTLGGVQIIDLCDINMKGLSSLIQIKKDVRISIYEQNLYKIDHSEKIDTMIDLNQQLIKLQKTYVQELITESLNNCDEDLLDKNYNLTVVEDKIHRQQVKQVSPLKAYPQFNNKLQQVQELMKDQKNDIALAISLQMMEDYRNFPMFQADIFTEISQICKFGQKYFDKYIEIDFQYQTELDRIHRILSEHHFDLKNYSQSLYHLLKVENQPEIQNSGLYFAQIRFAQIYYKLKNKEKLREKLNQISDRFNNDPCLYYLEAKLSILNNQGQNSVIHKFELSINQVNTHPIFYLKYIKYLNQVGNKEKARQIQERYQNQKFLINFDHRDSNICSKNYFVGFI